MKRKLLSYILFFSIVNLFAQVEDAWLYFNDKPSELNFMAAPLTMLSQRALDRRTNFNIALDYKDVPVELSYINQVSNATGITVLAKSKWLNALYIQGSQTDIQALLGFNFVEKIEYATKTLNRPNNDEFIQKSFQKNNKLTVHTNINYGAATNQIEMLKGEVLHLNNFTGEGIQIAVIDAGFPYVDTFSAFQKIRTNNQILGGYDFVNRSPNFYTGHYHGMMVLSTIAGNIENEFVGTAPDAKFYLFITEDSDNETPLEESLWVEAAEKADSLGVDIINTSLGYSTFDNPNHNYTYKNMDGQTTFISRGAEIAFSRGMLLVNSAGNEGNSSWKYIVAPADAPSVLSVGAVNSTGTVANFSSFGPTADERIKPNVCAQGAGVSIINTSGAIATDNGTSFSSPILAGIIACLWQAFPNKTNAEILQLVQESAHLYPNSTTQEGYGIPNFENIYNLLKEESGIQSTTELVVFPNPTSTSLNIKFPLDIEEMEVTMYNLVGMKVLSTKVRKTNFDGIDILHLAQGLYFVQIAYSNSLETIKLFKN